jgi:hypothetical protein
MVLMTLGLACGPPPPADLGVAGVGATAKPEAEASTADLGAKHELSVTRRCGRRCMYRRRGVSELHLAIGPHGVASARDEGAHIESFRWAGGDKEVSTEWLRGFEGSWTEGDGVLTVDLAPTDFRCVSRTGSGHGDGQCEARPLRLRCELLEVPMTKRRRTRRADRVPAWVCTSVHVESDPAHTPFPWVFGVDAPIVARDRGDADAPDRGYKLVRSTQGSGTVGTGSSTK